MMLRAMKVNGAVLCHALKKRHRVALIARPQRSHHSFKTSGMAAVAHKMSRLAFHMGALFLSADCTNVHLAFEMVPQRRAADDTAAGRLLRGITAAQLGHGLTPARTAINSAATLTAISSGVSAPIFRPIGAWTAAIASSETTSPRRFSMANATFLRLPIMPR